MRQYADSPPADVEAETLLFNPNDNVVPGESRGMAPKPVPGRETDAPGPSFGLPLPLTVSPDEVPQLLEDTKQVQRVIQQRNEMLESISGKSRP